MNLRLFLALGFVPLVAAAATLPADNKSVAAIEIHYAARHFAPEKIEVPAGKPLTLRVINDSQERIEFESFKLHREKVVEPGTTLVLHLPALKPGTYDFFDDFHEDVHDGQITAR